MSSHQTVIDYTVRQWFPNTQQFRFLTACRHLEKLVLPSIFDTSLSSFMMWKLQSYLTAVFNERMWHLGGGVKPLLHSYRGSRPPNRQDLHRVKELLSIRRKERDQRQWSKRALTYIARNHANSIYAGRPRSLMKTAEPHQRQNRRWEERHCSWALTSRHVYLLADE